MLLLLRRLLFRYFLKPHCRGSVNILSSTPLHAACLSRRQQESALALQRSSHSWPWSTASIDSNRAPALRMKSRWEKGTKITSSIESCRPSKNYTLLFPDGRQNAIRNQSDNDQFHPRSITHYIRGGKGNGRSQVSAKLLLRIIMR